MVNQLRNAHFTHPTVRELKAMLDKFPEDAKVISIVNRAILIPDPKLKKVFRERGGLLYLTERESIEPCAEVQVVEL